MEDAGDLERRRIATLREDEDGVRVPAELMRIGEVLARRQPASPIDRPIHLILIDAARMRATVTTTHATALAEPPHHLRVPSVHGTLGREGGRTAVLALF